MPRAPLLRLVAFEKLALLAGLPPWAVLQDAPLPRGSTCRLSGRRPLWSYRFPEGCRLAPRLQVPLLRLAIFVLLAPAAGGLLCPADAGAASPAGDLCDAGACGRAPALPNGSRCRSADNSALLGGGRQAGQSSSRHEKSWRLFSIRIQGPNHTRARPPRTPLPSGAACTNTLYASNTSPFKV